MGKGQYTAQQFIDAIPGSGGIKSTIAQRVGCSWSTVDVYIKKYSTIAAAYADELEGVLDLAESVLLQNIQFVKAAQNDHKKPVDTSDVKWLLSKRGKARGYGDKQELEVTGKDGAPLLPPAIVFEPHQKDDEDTETGN
jgi:hypothetical protein